MAGKLMKRRVQKNKKNMKIDHGGHLEKQNGRQICQKIGYFMQTAQNLPLVRICCVVPQMIPEDKI